MPSPDLMPDRPARQSAPDRLFPLTRHLSHWLTPLLAATPLTPNQITGLSLAAGLAGAACFAAGPAQWGVLGALLLILAYTLDNCDGEIARMKGLSSAWGAKFDHLADWLVDGAFFAALGYGTWMQTGEILWLWLGVAAASGASIDYLVDLVHDARARAAGRLSATPEEEATAVRRPRDLADWLIYIFHKLSRADFCIIVLALALFESAWILLPLAAVGAQIYWVTDLFGLARGWHT